MSKTEVNIKTIDNYINNPNKIVHGVEDIFKDDSKYPLIKSYYDAIRRTIEAAGSLYPYDNDGFVELRERISEKIGRALTAEETESINRDAVIYGIYKLSDGKIHHFNRDVAAVALMGPNSIKNRLAYMKRQYPDHPLLRNLHESDFKTDEKSPIDAINFNNVIDRSAWNKDSITYDFEDTLYESEGEELAAFYDDLITYNLWTSGFRSGYTSFSEFIPLKNLSEMGYRDALIKLDKESNEAEFFEEFDDIFFKNSYRNESVVPYIAKRDMKNKKGKGLVTSFTVEKSSKAYFDNEFGKGWVPFLTRNFYNKKLKRTEVLLYELLDKGKYELTDKYGWPGKLQELTGQASILKENYVNKDDFVEYEEIEDDFDTATSGEEDDTIYTPEDKSTIEETESLTQPVIASKKDDISDDFMRNAMKKGKVQRVPVAKLQWAKHGKTINENMVKAGYREMTEAEWTKLPEDRREKAIECYG